MELSALSGRSPTLPIEPLSIRCVSPQQPFDPSHGEVYISFELITVTFNWYFILRNHLIQVTM